MWNTPPNPWFYELSSKLHANGKVVSQRNNWCLWYAFIVLSKLCNVTENLIQGTLMNSKKTMARVIWDWEAVPCSFRNLYATLPNVLNKHRIDRNGDGNYLIQSFICSSFRFKEGVERFFFFTKMALWISNCSASYKRHYQNYLK